MLYTSLENGFGQNAVDVFQILRHLGDSLELSSEEADVRPFASRKAFFFLLCQILSDHICAFESITDGHVDVHDNKFVDGAIAFKSTPHHLKTFLSVRRQVTLYLVLLQQVDHGDRAEEVVVDDEHLHISTL